MASERDLEIFKRWDKYLTPEQKKELEYQNIQRKADFYLVNSRFEEARVLYKSLLKSTMTRRKYIGIRGLILCRLKLSIT